MDRKSIIGEEDRINQLSDLLLYEILKYHTTKDVIRSSLVCRRWRNLWRYVPALDMDLNGSVKDYAKFSFLNRFIDSNRYFCLHRVKLRNVGYWYDHSFAKTIQTLFRQKVEHLDIHTRHNGCTGNMGVEIPPTIYTSCERLVSLKLNRARFPKPPKSVSLPCLKMMDLEQVLFADNLGMEILISCVEDLTISSDVLMVIIKFSMLKPLPEFSKLSFLRVKDMTIASWEFLLIFLRSCPNLKSLAMGFDYFSTGINFWDVPHCVLSSLEFVEIRSGYIAPSTKKLGGYFVSNSTRLAKLTLILDNSKRDENDYVILDELFALPRRSNTCEVVVRFTRYGTYKPLSLLPMS